MMQKACYFLLGLGILSGSGFAQINKHSFGAGVSNGFIHIPENKMGFNQNTGEEIINPAQSPYFFGIGGSYLNSTKKWLAWRTNLNFGVTSRYEDFPESFDGLMIRFSQRDFFAELSFGPMFTYQKEDFGIYIGGTLDLMYVVSHKKGITWTHEESIHYAPFPIPTPSAYIGYWQRIGNVNSPWYFEISLTRKVFAGVINLIEYQRGPVFYAINTGFRYELKY